MSDDMIVLAGATGDLGGRIARALVERGAKVVAIVRPDSGHAALRAAGVACRTVEFADPTALAEACRGAACVVSALSGLAPVILEAQGRLLDATVAAGVPRFIPSDYSIDFQRIPPQRNRNLALRRQFAARVDAAPIRATSILNGAFADMLAGTMPIIQRRISRVLYWGDADQRLDFTTMDDTARFTAAAALDPDTPRYLRIAGMQPSARDIAAAMTVVTGRRFGTLYAGGIGVLDAMIRIARVVQPGTDTLYPAWQGMQYSRNMFAGEGHLTTIDNARYPGTVRTGLDEVLRRAFG